MARKVSEKALEVVEPLRPLVREFFREAVTAVLSADTDFAPLWTAALLPPYASRAAVAERSIVTRLGNISVKLVTQFFRDVKPLSKPFDFAGFLSRNGRWYEVKVVSSVKAFNSTTAARVVRHARSHNYEHPVVLTVHGWWEDTHKKVLGDYVVWFDAVASWALLTGVRDAYWAFSRMVFEEARPYRAKIAQFLREGKSRA